MWNSEIFDSGNTLQSKERKYKVKTKCFHWIVHSKWVQIKLNASRMWFLWVKPNIESKY